MATRRKSNIPEKEVINSTVEETTPQKEEVILDKPVASEAEIVSESKTNSKVKEPKYKIGDIVFVSKEAEADLNGFKLFPPYKKYTYTVEAYDQNTGVYSLRRLNLSLRLKEALILAPNERAHDSLNRKQF